MKKDTSDIWDKSSIRKQVEDFYSKIHIDVNIDNYFVATVDKNYMKGIVCSGNQFFIVYNFYTKRIDHISTNFFKLMGYKNAPETMEDFFNLIHPSDLNLVLNILKATSGHGTLRQQKPFDEHIEITVRHILNGGEIRWFQHEAAIIETDETKAPLRLLVIYTDIHDVKKDNITEGRYVGVYPALEKEFEKIIKNHQSKQRFLTDREGEILNLLVEGNSSKTIADKLYLSKHTIDTYRRRLLAHFNVRNTKELILYVVNNKIIK